MIMNQFFVTIYVYFHKPNMYTKISRQIPIWSSVSVSKEENWKKEKKKNDKIELFFNGWLIFSNYKHSHFTIKLFK